MNLDYLIESDDDIYQSIIVDATAVAQHLVNRKLIGASDVIDGKVGITRIVRRNLCFKVDSANSPSYWVKWPGGEDRRLGLAHEAAVYLHLITQNSNNEASPWPTMHDYDADHQVIVLELLPAAVNLREYHQHRGATSVLLAKKLGHALATLHAYKYPISRMPYPSAPPWVFRLHEPPLTALPHMPDSVAKIIGLIQSHATLPANLSLLSTEWEMSSLVHGDIKWDNCVIYPSTAPGGRFNQLALVDWELAVPGDPLWDVGCAIGSYLQWWLRSIPFGSQARLEDSVSLATRPLGSVKRAIGALWKAYMRKVARQMAVEPCLNRVARFAGAFLVKAAIENLHVTPALTTGIVAQVQLGANILARPDDAWAQLMGGP